MTIYSKVISDMIEKERQGISFYCNEHDKMILREMLCEINHMLDSDLHYLCELVHYKTKNCGEIILRYINKFESEEVKGYLVPKLIEDKLKGIEDLVLELYIQFKNSRFYISPQNSPSNAHIYVRYDNVFKSLKPIKLKMKLFEIVKNPRDAYYLPLTTKLISSWGIPQMKELLLAYLDGSTITNDSIDIFDGVGFYPSLETIKRELKFIAIGGLKYYPTCDVIHLINALVNDEDKDIAQAAKKTLLYINKNASNINDKVK